jgi:hypothetical protein
MTQLRILSSGVVVIYLLTVVFHEVSSETIDHGNEVVAVGGPVPSLSEVVTVAAFVLLVTVAVAFAMPVVSKARSRFESDAGSQGSDLPPERR